MPSSADDAPHQATDLSLFLQPSFDAASYVSAIISAVDASVQHGEGPSSHLQPHLTPPAATAAVGGRTKSTLPPVSPHSPISPVRPKPVHDQTLDLTPKERKREQAQEDVDVSLAISRLNLAIEELDRSISGQVTAHAPALLKRTSNLASMQIGVKDVRAGIATLQTEVDALRTKVHDPFVRAEELQAKLKVYDSAGELVARTRKVVGLARRLETQMEALFARKENEEKEGGRGGAAEGEDAVVGQVHGRDLSRAALLIAEISSLLETKPDCIPAEQPPDDARVQSCSLLELQLVQDLVPTLESARKTVVDYMEDMIVRGLRDLSPLMLSSSLQTAYNLNMLPTLVHDLLNDLTEVVKERTAGAFDLDSLSRQLGAPPPDPSANSSYTAYRSGRRANLPTTDARGDKIWADAVWKKLESLIVVEMGAVCSKVYLLEKVLKLKTDSETGVNLLDAALQVLGDKPSYTFWLTFSSSLQQSVAHTTARSPWLAAVLSEGYPKLLRLFAEFFAKIGLYTDVQYLASHQSPETVILLRGLTTLEKAYVDRSTARIAEVLSSIASGNRRGAAGWGEEEGEGVARGIGSALDATRFDPLLSRAIVERCSTLVDEFASRVPAVVEKNASAWTLSGSESGATQAQVWNASLVRFSFSLVQGLESIARDQDSATLASPSRATESAAAVVVASGGGSGPSVSFASMRLLASCTTLTTSIRTTLLTPLLTQLTTSLSVSLAKMHVQLATSSTTSKSGGVVIDATSGASPYASEVCDVLWQVRDRLFRLYPAPLHAVMAQKLARTLIHTFLLHAAILTLPQHGADAVRLRIATDITELEFALAQFTADLGSSSLHGATRWVDADTDTSMRERRGEGESELKSMLKTFRRILFADDEELEAQLSQEERSAALAKVVLLLHVLVRQRDGEGRALLDGVLSAFVPKAKPGVTSGGVKTAFVHQIQQSISSPGGGDALLQRIRSSISTSNLSPNASRILTHLAPPPATP